MHTLTCTRTPHTHFYFAVSLGTYAVTAHILTSHPKVVSVSEVLFGETRPLFCYSANIITTNSRCNLDPWTTVSTLTSAIFICL